MSRSDDGLLVVVDLSNLCRDRRLLAAGVLADETIIDRFVEALESSDIAFGQFHCVADRSLPPLLGQSGKRRLREMEQEGTLEYSAIADEVLLDVAFAMNADASTMVASMDNFDDFRRSYPSIQGSTDRFIGWEPSADNTIRVFHRDMGVHAHHRLSRKEEGEELKARRLRRQSIVRQATNTYFRCESATCLIAQLWPERIPDLPRYDDQGDRLVCSSCGGPLAVGEPRPESTQLIVFLHGTERGRLILDEGQRLEIGRSDGKGCVGLESRLGSEVAAGVSRRHVAFERLGGHVTVEDLGSRNGSVLRWLDGSHPDAHLLTGTVRTVGRGHTIALPSGITIERSGRSIPLDGDRAPGTGQPEDAPQMTLRVSRRP